MDKIIRIITSDGGVMACAIDSTRLVQTAQKVHRLTKTSSAALGRLLSAAAILGAMQKIDGSSVTLKVNGGGPLGTMVAIADARGNVKGYADHPEVDLPVRPDGKIDVGGAVGSAGRLAVFRDMGKGEPYVGQVELLSGEIAEDITQYFAQSEQIPTVCALGVLVEKESGNVLLSGGLFLQILPGAEESVADRLERNVNAMASVTKMLSEGLTPEEMCMIALKGFDTEILDETAVRYACNCSKERFRRAILTLGSKDILSFPLDENGRAEAVCNYCGKRYYFSKGELEDLAERARISEQKASGN